MKSDCTCIDMHTDIVYYVLVQAFARSRACDRRSHATVPSFAGGDQLIYCTGRLRSEIARGCEIIASTKASLCSTTASD